MKKIKLALAIHNHQPVGNFESIFEYAMKKAYFPFLELLEKHPQIKMSLHYTGILLEWIQNHSPEFLDRLKNLIERRQIEMITGGYYEPILINLHDSDKIGQIDKLTEFIKKHLNDNATGMWLAERIWEPGLPSPLKKAGIDFTIIDDSHFKTAGLEENDLYGYYVTENLGATMCVFPISEKLRYYIPFQEPQVTIDYLWHIADDSGSNLIVFADDGEKFGVWPETHKHCYEDKWLERFFNTIEQNLDWIEIIHFSEALSQLEPKGIVYLPTASYREMMEWAMPPKSIQKYQQFENKLKDHQLFEQYKLFVRGGFWRNFLAKYPESNNMHKKALRVNQKLDSLAYGLKKDERYKRAQDHLWAGQCNCPYWHGVFGGLYLNHIRNAIYKNLINAEVLIDDLKRTPEEIQNGWIDEEIFDFNCDGHPEIIIESQIYNIIFSPQFGGMMFELDYRPLAINLLDTMTRREEAYHQALLQKDNNTRNGEFASIHDKIQSKEPDLDKGLIYDWHRRAALLDHFLHPDTTFDQMRSSQFHDLGDFTLEPYRYETKKEQSKFKIRMFRNGAIRLNNSTHNIYVQKEIEIFPDSTEILINYKVKNLEANPVDIWFAIEFNYGLLAGNAPDRFYYFENNELSEPNLASTGTIESVRKMGLKDLWQKAHIQLQYSIPAMVWRFPIETVSQSERGMERVYQNSVILPNWKFRLSSKGEWKVRINHNISQLL
ncbi:DUF1926 domain-containing protein [candidate division KSB1 bacterium]|nr:DUF1926 domain-containing protein [candidate division KSB1 bacterium]